MALTRDDKSCKDQSGKTVCESYKAQLPHWVTTLGRGHPSFAPFFLIYKC